MNKYLRVSLTLSLIAGGAALLIGVMNLLTSKTIETNKSKKIENGLAALLMDEQIKDYKSNDFLHSTDEGYDLRYSLDTYPSIKTMYTVNCVDGDIYYVYSTSEKNSYGQVELLLPFKEGSKEMGKIYIVTNTESYATTLEDNYINKYNNGYITLADTKCGATYGAKTVKNQCDMARAHYEKYMYGTPEGGE